MFPGDKQLGTDVRELLEHIRISNAANPRFFSMPGGTGALRVLPDGSRLDPLTQAAFTATVSDFALFLKATKGGNRPPPPDPPPR